MSIKKSFQQFVILNISKTRRFPTYRDTKGKDAPKGYEDDTDMYSIYHLSKKDMGKYLNTWFKGGEFLNKKSDIIHRSELWTVKKVDKDTALHLYNQIYNPVSLTIMCLTGGDKNPNYGKLYNMKAQIHSIDDSSYGVWWNNRELTFLKETQNYIMKWLNSKTILNGEEFIQFCLTLDAEEDSVDYN
jgi:hypothetical protein